MARSFFIAGYRGEAIGGFGTPPTQEDLEEMANRTGKPASVLKEYPLDPTLEHLFNIIDVARARADEAIRLQPQAGMSALFVAFTNGYNQNVQTHHGVITPMTKEELLMDWIRKNRDPSRLADYPLSIPLPYLMHNLMEAAAKPRPHPAVIPYQTLDVDDWEAAIMIGITDGWNAAKTKIDALKVLN